MTAMTALVLAAQLALPAAGGGKAPCSAPEAHAFDFWLGEWNVVNHNRSVRKPDDPTWYDTGTATDRVEAVAGGCGIVEDWRGDLSFGKVRGFSLRAWDAARKAWKLVLSWPIGGKPGFTTLEGSFHHRRGEFFTEKKTPEGGERRSRFTFSDIAPESLRWDSAVSTDGGLAWKTTWIMEFTRRAADAAPLPREVGPPLDLCSAPESRELDALFGTWEGPATRTLEGVTETLGQVRATVAPLLDGCAVEERTTIRWKDGRSVEIYAVEAWDPDAGTWVAYSVDSARGELRRWTGHEVDGGFQRLADTGRGAWRERVTWRRDPSGSPRLEREISTNGGRVWRTIFEAPLAPLAPLALKDK